MCCFFEKVIKAMEIASEDKLQKCLENVKWDFHMIHDILCGSNFKIYSYEGCFDGCSSDNSSQGLEELVFECLIPFEANEVSGIILPFCCLVMVNMVFDKNKGKCNMCFSHQTKGIMSPFDDNVMYDVDSLHVDLHENEPEMCFCWFVDENFDFEKICEEYENHEKTHPQEEKTIKEDNTYRMEVIKVVKFADFMNLAIGTFMDEHFKKEGWELQLVKAYGGNGSGYQVFFGPGVQVDNHYEYGFSYLYELEDVIAFAENFYDSRALKNKKEDSQK